jgi:aminoglycoside phosphotransferase (APT) family kinase protein
MSDHEPLDIEQHNQLLTYLRATNRIAASETPQMKTLAGGVSNRTVRVTRESGQAWVLKQALAKLRVDVDWFSDPSRVHREALGLRWLEKLAPPGTITPLVFEDVRHHLIAMDAVAIPHENWKTVLLSGFIDAPEVEQFASILATIHRRSLEHAATLRDVFGDRSFFESLRIEPYYAYTATQVPEASSFLHALIADTRNRSICLVHGDYSPKNILIRNGRLILLDHEVIHWGDPAFDIGFALTHLLSKANHFEREVRGFFIEEAARFCTAYGGDCHGLFGARHALACLLARVAGRSTLEYLDDDARRRQRRITVELMSNLPPPGNVFDLIESFASKLSC